MMSPVNVMRSTFAFWTMVAEANTVVTLRVLGLAGVLPADRAENGRMIAEKGPAFTAAMTAGGRAAMKGQTPDRIALAMIRPLGRKTRANVRRLSKT